MCCIDLFLVDFFLNNFLIIDMAIGEVNHLNWSSKLAREMEKLESSSPKIIDILRHYFYAPLSTLMDHTSYVIVN